MSIEPLLQLMIDRDGSDLFISVGKEPSIKIHVEVHAVGSEILSASMSRESAPGLLVPSARRGVGK